MRGPSGVLRKIIVSPDVALNIINDFIFVFGHSFVSNTNARSTMKCNG